MDVQTCKLMASSKTDRMFISKVCSFISYNNAFTMSTRLLCQQRRPPGCCASRGVHQAVVPAEASTRLLCQQRRPPGCCASRGVHQAVVPAEA
ncbi:hypothetical protein BgiMline_036266 [Biomphalaria glabrata]|nr:hypothetical protein BgiMline_014796 [Biomphalaria glabrata]